MAVEIIGKMKPKNNGAFALIDAADVEMPDGKRLSEFDPDKSPVIDLVALGLPVIPSLGGSVSVEADTTEIMTALQNGAVRFGVKLGAYGVEMGAEVLTTVIGSDEMGGYYCGGTLVVNDVPYLANIEIGAGGITATLMVLQKKTAVATSINMTAFEAEGKIVETYADGTNKTTTMEFDADGNPVKITDGDGNVTTITW